VTSAESDYLYRLAALSLSFVGFSAIVVTLRGAMGGKLSDRHLRLVRLYIEGGLLVTALALVPPLLQLIHVPDTVIWPVSSAVAGAIFTLVLLIQFRRRRRVEPGPFPLWVVVIYVLSTVVVAGLWFNVAGVSFAAGAGPYAVALTWALCLFGFIFVRTIELFLHRPPEA
jgi:RsiW-degrading membrane proteinase PrsW (M82 family)